jgi:hypothetical protein
MAWQKCRECGRYHYDFEGPHTCPPRWRCWNLTHEESPKSDPGRIVYAFDAEAAAKDVVERDDNVVDGSTFEIAVQAEAGGPIKRWSVEAVLTMLYHTSPLDEADASDGGA